MESQAEYVKQLVTDIVPLLPEAFGDAMKGTPCMNVAHNDGEGVCIYIVPEGTQAHFDALLDRLTGVKGTGHE